MPIRIEFYNDIISSINTFNIESERRLKESLDELSIISIVKEPTNRENMLVMDHINDSIIITDYSIENLIKKNIKIKKFIEQNKIININPLKIDEPAYKFKLEYIDDGFIQSLSDLSDFIRKKK